MACIDLHAKACKVSDMAQTLIHEIREFLAETGLSAYRFGFKAARNGRLVERLEAGNPILNTTEQRVREFIKQERRKRQTVQS